MVRRTHRALLALLTFHCGAASVLAQNSEGVPDKTPVLSYALTVLFTIGTLVILCMPSRKT